MYSISGWLDFVRARPAARQAARPLRVPRNVIFLGLTSLFTDISSEMVVSILPVYLVTFLALSPVQFGFVDGLYQGVAGLVQLGSAVLTDRWRRYREMAGLGYVASALTRAGLLMTSTWGGITVALTIDRIGKGIRTAPRDALVSLSASQDQLGLAFGAHRALDAVGAMLGPIVAFVILQLIANGFDVIFAASLCFAIIGVAFLGFFVENPQTERLASQDGPRVTAGTIVALFRDAHYRHLALAALLFGMFTISDGFIYLSIQRQLNVSAGAFPLLFVATSAVYLLSAVPAGRLADRFGRMPVFLAGHVCLLAVYVALFNIQNGTALIAVAIVLLGMRYGATDGVLMAIGSSLLPPSLRTSGLAMLTTIVALAHFIGSVLFGVAWSRFDLPIATVGFAAGLGAAIAAVALTRPPAPEEA